MRCACCDRPAVPQALGRARDGKLVFGWCLDCLQATGCTDIEVARVTKGRPANERDLPPLVFAGTTARPTPRRRRAVLSIALILSAWSLILMISGIWAFWKKISGPPNPFGTGTPLFLLVGGGSTGVTAILLRVCAARETNSKC